METDQQALYYSKKSLTVTITDPPAIRYKGHLVFHLNKELPGNVVKLKPINTIPLKATLLNDGRAVDFVVRFSPSDHNEQKAWLNLINLPSNELSNNRHPHRPAFPFHAVAETIFRLPTHTL